MNRKYVFYVMAIGLVLTGCGYEPKPIDIHEINKELEKNNLQLFLKSLNDISKEFDFSNGISEKEAVFVALAQNPGILAERKRERISEAQIMIAKQIENPTLGLEMNHNKLSHANGYEWELSQLVTDLIKRSYKKDRAEVGAEKVRQKILLKEWELINKTKEQYLNILFKREKLKNSKEELKLAEKLKEIAQKRLNAGAILQVEYNSIEVDRLKAHQRVLLAETDLKSEKLSFSALLGFPPEYALTIQPDFDFYDIYENIFDAKKYEAYSLTKRIQFKILLLEYELSEKDLEIHYFNRYPMVEVGPRLEEGEGKGDDSYGLSLGIRIPIWNQNQGNIKKGKIERERIEKELKASIVEGKFEVQNVVLKANLARDILNAYKNKILALVESNLELSNKSYQLGKIDLFQEIKAQNQYIESKREFLNILFDYKKNVIDLESAAGGSIGEIEKGLTVSK